MSAVAKYQANISSENGWYCHGPEPHGGSGQFRYEGWYLNPQSRFDTADLAKQVSVLLNLAYQAGYEQAQAEMRKAVGL